MLHIIVDDQQAKLIAIAKQRQASDEPRYTTRDVLDHLRSLAHEQ